MFLSKMKGFFSKIGNVLAKPFVMLKNKLGSSKLAILVSLQLKDKWNFSFKANKKAAAFKIITYIVIFAALCAVSYFVMNLLTNKFLIFITPFLPVTAMNVILLALTIFEGISILIGLTRSLFFAKDNVILITYPVKSSYIFTSKIIVYLIDGIKNSITLFLPILIGYGIVNNIQVYYYFWAIIALVIFIVFLVCVCSLLTIPTYFVMKFLNKYKMFRLVFAVVVLGLVAFGAFKVITLIPESINLIRTFEKFAWSLKGFLDTFADKLSVWFSITTFLCGVKLGYSFKVFTSTTWIVLAALIVLIPLLLFVNYLIAKPFYLKMIATSHNFRQTNTKEKPNKAFNSKLSMIQYEILRIIRDEKMLVATVISVVASPLIILLINRFYGAFNTSKFGDNLIVMFNFLFIGILAFTHNITSSYIYSKDGPSWNINKTMPVDPRRALTSRLIYNAIVSVLIVLPASFVFLSTGRIKIEDAIFFILTLLILSLFHNVISASYDFMHSEDKTRGGIGSEYIKKHENISLVMGILTALASAGLGLLMAYTGTFHIFLRLFIMATLTLCLEVYLFMKRIYATYQEN